MPKRLLSQAAPAKRAKSILALKLTNAKGCTANGSNRRLKVGRLVKRADRSSMLFPCGDTAVHAYKDLTQARRFNYEHCNHRGGILWLVRLNGPEEVWGKLIGTSYRVLKRLGPMRTANAADVHMLLRGLKP